jgi:hypothetical protein
VAFNVSNFVKSTSKSISNRILDNATTTAISGASRNAQLIAKTTAQSLFNIGASFDSVEAFSTQKTDSILSGASNEYFAMAGKSPSRIAANKLSSLRRTGSESAKVYVESINPQTKVANAKSNQQFTTYTVV